MDVPGVLVPFKWVHIKVGVNENGVMYLEKDGKRLRSMQGHTPNNVNRNKNYIGHSNWPNDEDFDGVIMDLSFTGRVGEFTTHVSESPLTAEIGGAFDITAIARIDSLEAASDQKIFDFSNGPRQDNSKFPVIDLSFHSYLFSDSLISCSYSCLWTVRWN